MDLRIDDRGKYFTARIAKDSLAAFVRTGDQLIVGQIHVRPERRLTDEINGDSARFLPITAARVYDAAGTTLLYESSFLLVSYQHIVTIGPLEALSPHQPAPWHQPSTQGEVE
jgi:hypothetical protein